MKIRLGVLFGGMSVEHEVSIITAIQAMNNLDNTKYEIVPIYIAKDGIWYTGNMLKDMLKKLFYIILMVVLFYKVKKEYLEKL